MRGAVEPEERKGKSLSLQPWRKKREPRYLAKEGEPLKPQPAVAGRPVGGGGPWPDPSATEKQRDIHKDGALENRTEAQAPNRRTPRRQVKKQVLDMAAHSPECYSESGQ